MYVQTHTHSIADSRPSSTAFAAFFTQLMPMFSMRTMLCAVVSTPTHQLLLQPLPMPCISSSIFPSHQILQGFSSVQPVLSLLLALIHYPAALPNNRRRTRLTRICQWNPGPPLVPVVFSDWGDGDHGDWTYDADDAGPEEGGLFVRGPAEVFYGLGPEVGF